MKRELSILFVAAICLPQVGCFLGKPDVCAERNPASFSTFVDEQWSQYCDAYTTHVEAPSQYTLSDLTEFFAAHPAKVKELNEKLYRFEKYETCFDSPKEELELRALQGCLTDNDESDLEIINAWKIAADPWLTELEFKADAIKPKLDETEREGARLFKKSKEAFELHARQDDGPFLAFAAQVDEIDKGLTGLEGVAKQYEALLAAAKGNEALVSVITAEAGPRLTSLDAEAAEMRQRTETLKNGRRYLELATYSAGVACPSSKKARTESKIANKIVGGRNNEVRGSGVRIRSKITEDQQGEIDLERFSGFICGVRSRDNQFDGLPQLCGQYQFVLERQAEGEDADWSDWTMKSFEESGPTGGIDCAMLSGELPKPKKRRKPVDDGY